MPPSWSRRIGSETPPTWHFAPPGYVNELRQTGENESQLADIDAAFTRITRTHASDVYRADEDVEVMQRKNFAATGGAFAEPSRARSLLGTGQEAGIPVVFHVGGTADLV
jgi:hypothetical protein